ncbi:ABC transporter permease OS=Streptomyces microflavus OX=1919 GN=HUT09_03470 PE=4 SV=1 [Streptomyces microflavus]
MLPLALAGMGAGAAVTLLGLRGARAVLTLTGSAALVGLAATAVAHSWLGVITGDWWTEAGVLALTVLAISAAVAGLAALLGPRPGARPRRAADDPAGQLLLRGHRRLPAAPDPVGVIGQWLPPGAGGSLLRSVAFFDGSAGGRPRPDLALWSALGLAAVLIAGRRMAAAPAGPAGPAGPAPVTRETAMAG